MCLLCETLRKYIEEMFMPFKVKISLLFLLILTFSSVASAQNWDWHIDNATVIDGTGKESYQADLLIQGDLIGYIGEVNPDTVSAKNYVDASDKVVTPGFIDVHAHGDPLETPQFQNFLAMGVTTIVLGQDGSSPAVGNLDEWFNKAEEANPAVNIAMFSGHGSIRSKVGIGNAEPSASELTKMKQHLESDLKAGAFGMSLGLEYVPGMYAERNELEQLAKIVGEHGGIVMSHMRSEDDSKIEASIRELAALGKFTPVHASHLKVVYGKGAKRAEEIVDYIQSFREQAIEFSADVYPYEASFTGIGIVFPKWAKTESGWRQAVKERPDVLRSFLEDKVEQRNGPDAILFGSGAYSGKTLREAANQEDLSPVDLLMEMGPQGGSAAHFVMDEALQDRIVTADGVMISSDGSPTMRHPRGYGSFAKIIHHYVNKEKLLSLEKAVYKMSGLPAATLGLEDRGTIQEGKKADLLIFDPDEIKDQATFANPHQPAEGFDWVMVNGEIAKENGNFDKRSGKMLKKE